MNWAIECEKVFQHIDGHCILSNISFKLLTGQCLVLIGANGASKTQLLKLLTGLEEVSAGQIHVFQKPVKTSHDGYKISFNETVVSMVFQSGSLLGDLTVLDNLLLPLRNSLLDTHAMYHRARLLMTRLQLDGYENHFINHLTKGIQRKVEFARAIINKPDLLLIDGIDDGMDKRARFEMIKLLEDQKNRGTTLVIVTHEPTLYHHIIDKVGVMSNGQLLFFGVISDLSEASQKNIELNFATTDYL